MDEKQNEQLSNDQCNADARGSFHDLPAKVGIVVGQLRAFIRAFHLGSNACTGSSFAVVRPGDAEGWLVTPQQGCERGSGAQRCELGATAAESPIDPSLIPASFPALIPRGEPR